MPSSGLRQRTQRFMPHVTTVSLLVYYWYYCVFTLLFLRSNVLCAVLALVKELDGDQVLAFPSLSLSLSMYIYV